MDNEEISEGRPRLSVDFAIVLRLREVENLGWSRMAEAYRKITSQYISRDTIKRRYLEAKAQEGTTTNRRINDHESLP
jgi:hypothetical protein